MFLKSLFRVDSPLPQIKNIVDKYKLNYNEGKSKSIPNKKQKSSEFFGIIAFYYCNFFFPSKCLMQKVTSRTQSLMNYGHEINKGH